jgi:ribosome biogenesis GTPase
MAADTEWSQTGDHPDTEGTSLSEHGIRSDDVPPLAALGWDPIVETAWAGVTGDLVPGRIARVERGACTVALADGDRTARSTVPVAVGDWVGVRRHGPDVTVEVVTRRRSTLVRRDPEGLLQVLASNIDVVFVTAPADRLSAARIEREIVVAWDSGTRPVVLVTKSDLAEEGLVEDLRARLIGVDVIPTSTVSGEGTDLVAASLRPCRTAVLLGPSGAGKSSLANALLGAERLATGDVRSGDRRGRHTTTARQLLVVPGGGVLIDTPGIRSLSLAGGDGLARAFAEIEALAAECRFADCRHEGEPGCAVMAAAEAGRLDPHRMASFHKLQRELDFETRRDDPAGRREIQRQRKIRSKAARRYFQERGDRR